MEALVVDLLMFEAGVEVPSFSWAPEDARSGRCVSFSLGAARPQFNPLVHPGRLGL